MGTQWPDSAVTLPAGSYRIRMRNLNRIELGRFDGNMFYPPSAEFEVSERQTFWVYVDADDHRRWTVEFYKTG